MSSIEDISFYNILGELISRRGIVQEMIDFYTELLQAGETRVTDFNEGSEIRNLLEAYSVDGYNLREDQYELSQIPFISTAYGEWLDLHGENPLLQLPRNKGTEATGIVQFSIPDVLTVDYLIPENTVIASEETGLEYATESDAYIDAGDTSVEVFATCLTVGIDGNAKAGEITIIDDTLIDGDITVTNPEDFTSGEDYEEDDEYRERLLEYNQKAGFGSLDYYMDLGASVTGVHDVLLVDDPNEDYTNIVLVNGFEKPVSDNVLIGVLTEFTDITKKVINHNFMVDRPTYKTVDLTVNLEVETLIPDETILDLLNCVFNGGSTIDLYEFDGLSISQDLTKRTLYNAIEQLDYVVDVEVLYNGEEISTISAGDGAVLTLGDVTINQIEG